MNHIKYIIIDDDPMSLKVIESLGNSIPFLELKGAFQKPSDSLETINDVDLLIVDVEMPEMSGLEFLSSLPNRPQVVMVSRKSEYALESFEYEVTDYLKKPLNQTRFLKAILKVQKNLEKIRLIKEEEKNLFIKVDSVLKNFDLSEIRWIEAFGDYVKIKTGSKIHTVYSTMKNIENSLPGEQFVRVHRSFIVNIHMIDNIDTSNLQIENKIVPIGANYKDDFMSKINVL